VRVRTISIRNFRGIKELDWSVPTADICCLIGRGDSSKSTILEAVRFAFYPQWNLTLSDSDFYQCKVENAIVIEVSIGDLVEDFLSLNKYGLYLRGWNTKDGKLVDEPDDDLESVLTIRLTVAKDLEPKWLVVCDRSPDGVPFKQADRNKVSVGLIGAYSERQLSWATGTALAKLTEAQSLNELLATASRTARTSLDADRPNTLKSFDAAAAKSQAIAKLLGVPVAQGYKAHLDMTSINLKVGGLALHDGDIPLRQLGLGSRRMLLCGIQKMGLEDGHITLLDEVEFGLEPNRISRLLKHVREDKRGQYFLTTHSPVVLRELAINNLYIVHSKAGTVRVVPACCGGLAAHEAQGKIRSSAEALLARKVVVCEGATEVGFLRGYDDYQIGEGKDPFSYHGISLLNAGGASKIKALAEAFRQLGYEVCVVADGDAEEQFSPSHEAELEGMGIAVHVWGGKLSLEERAFQDLPWASVIAGVKLAQTVPSLAVYDNVRSKYQKELDRDVGKWVESADLRLAIGRAAKDCDWFKDITRGDLWFQAMSPAFADSDFSKRDIPTKLAKLWSWAERV